ncbi:MAG: enoyl-CoA hydratase/isomerase family protein, partial [Algicola sp.]|nr:enoyl-CoA hydratase/isomerase family protein [Algicola sp.]
MTSIRYEKDSHNIVHIIFDKPDSPVNLMDLGFADDLAKVAEKLLADDFAGVILRSTKKTFFAGGDLAFLSQTTDETASQIYDMSMKMKVAMRAMETCGKPLVACINGSALGGGFELALACHHRIVVADSRILLGLPEATLGLLPGAGGITRMVRLLGLQAAMPYLTQGKTFRPAQGIESGLIHQVVQSEQQLIDAARCWIENHLEVAQPYDIKGYKMPGGSPNSVVNSPALAQALAVAPIMIHNATRGTLPAPEAILSCMVEGAQVDFESAQRIESRYFTELARGQISTNLINTLWFAQNAIKAGKNRPSNIETTQFSKIGVFGAGMMGAGIAYACANKGIAVVLKDVSNEAAEKGKDYSRKLLQKQVDKGFKNQIRANEILDLIQTTAQAKDLTGCELVVEAVFEDRTLKAKVTQEVAPFLPKDVVFASNTSTLPITGLAEASQNPQNFIGIHFFSPVDKMPLVEVICGEQTNDQTLAKAWDFARQLGKTPIVVNDSRGFYTSRVFKTYVKEGIALLGEAKAASIENAAYTCGFPVGPLAVTDEVSLSLLDKIQKQNREDAFIEAQHPADNIIQTMLNEKRLGNGVGAGFYDYSGRSKQLWPALESHFYKAEQSIDFADIKDRLLFIMALETARCIE